MMRWDQVAAWVDDPRMGAELGVYAGQFTTQMLRRFPSLRLVAVDLWGPANGYAPYDFATVYRQYKQATKDYAQQLTTLRMDTVAAAFEFRDGTFDFVFIDACHEYEAVKADIAAWLPKVRRGGILCGHDYVGKHKGVKPAVDEIGLPVVTGEDATWMVRC